MPFNENRKCKRSSCDVPILVMPLDSKDLMEAKALNYCLDGMYFKSKYQLRPGTCICIEKRNEQVDGRSSARDKIPKAILAEIKWCSSISDSQVADYGAGAHYISSIFRIIGCS
jgi:hypothetical protein